MVLNNSVFRHTQSKRKVRKTEKKKGREEIMQQCVCGTWILEDEGPLKHPFLLLRSTAVQTQG